MKLFYIILFNAGIAIVFSFIGHTIGYQLGKFVSDIRCVQEFTVEEYLYCAGR